MRYCFPSFNINDSLKGDTPKQLFKEHFKYISKGALDLLKNRSIETIEFGALDINRIRERKTHEIAIELIRKGEKDFTLVADFENYEETNNQTPSTMLANELKYLNIDNEKRFPSARHYEYLAILSLMLIDVAIDLEDQLKTASSKEKKNELINSIKASAFNSLGALSLADKFLNNPPKEDPDNKNNRPISIRNKKAVDKRHMGRKRLDKKFRKIYYSNPPAKKIDVIRSFIKSLSKEELEELHPYSSKARERFFYSVLKKSPKGILF
jgi:hypothetical protein